VYWAKRNMLMACARKASVMVRVRPIRPKGSRWPAAQRVEDGEGGQSTTPIPSGPVPWR